MDETCPNISCMKFLLASKQVPFQDDHVQEKVEAEAMQDLYLRGKGGGLLGFGLVGAPTTEDHKREKFKKEWDELMTAT
jgi:hypothetical protein